MCAAVVASSLKNVGVGFKVLFSRKYLLYTNTGISVIMSCVGDGLQQKYQLGKREIPGWDKRRTRDVGIAGFFLGPFCHYWYILLDKCLPGHTFAIVMKKLVVDQLICSPIVISSFLLTTSYLEGKRGKELSREMVEKGKTLYLAEWIVWPPAQLVNFSIVPLKYRVLFDNSVSFGFDWYFSAVKYGKTDETVVKSESTDKGLLHWMNIASHVPFLHIQGTGTDIVQLKQDTFHILSDSWKRRQCRTKLNKCDSEVMVGQHDSEVTVEKRDVVYCEGDESLQDSDLEYTEDQRDDKCSIEVLKE